MDLAKELVILGTGNVAWHLIKALKKSGTTVSQIYSRDILKAEELAKLADCNFTSNIQEVSTNGMIFFALSDSAIEPVLKSRTWNDALLIHLAGSVPSKIFENHTTNYGVIYPLQSFTKGKDIIYSEIPFLIEGSNSSAQEAIIQLATKISQKTTIVDSQTRSYIHLAAVFASNYANFMVTISHQLLEKKQIDPSILNPLILETLQKAFEIGPIKAQTGPARRNNKEIIKKHEAMLEENPDWQKLYTFVAENIIKFYQHYDGKL